DGMMATATHGMESDRRALLERFRSLCAAFLAAQGVLTAARNLDWDVRPIPPRIVAVGDLHGDVRALGAIARAAGLMDDGGSWIGEHAHFVLMGDLMGGADSRLLLNAVKRLERVDRVSAGQGPETAPGDEVDGGRGRRPDVDPRLQGAARQAEGRPLEEDAPRDPGPPGRRAPRARPLTDARRVDRARPPVLWNL